MSDIKGIIFLPYGVCRLAYHFARLPLLPACGVYQVTQAYLTHMQKNNPALFATIHKMRWAFALADVGAIAWYGGKLLHVLDHKYSIFSFVAKPEMHHIFSFSLRALGIIAAAFFVSMVICAIAKNAFARSENPEEMLKKENVDVEQLKQITAKYDIPAGEICMRILNVANILVTIALAVFTPGGGIIYGVMAAVQAYSFIQNSQVEWIKMEKIYEQRDALKAIGDRIGKMVTKVIVTYYAALLPISKVAGPEVQMCSKHSVRFNALLKKIYQAFPHSLSALKFDERRRYSFDSPSVTLPQTTKPLCCAEENPEYNGYEIRVFNDTTSTPETATIKFATSN